MINTINVDLEAGSVELKIGSSTVSAFKGDMPVIFEALKGAYLVLSAVQPSDALAASNFLRNLGFDGLEEAAAAAIGAKKKRKSRKEL